MHSNDEHACTDDTGLSTCMHVQGEYDWRTDLKNELLTFGTSRIFIFLTLSL